MASSRVKVHWQSWGGAVCLALLLVSLALFAYWSAERSRNDLLRFNNELPLFEEIQNLRTALIFVESSVYEYYLTTDKSRFDARYSEQLVQIEQSLALLSAELGDIPELSALAQIHGELQSTTQVFVGVMDVKPIDWDGAREVLSWFSPLTERANSVSAELTHWMRDRVQHASSRYSQQMRITVYLVAGLTLICVLVGAWLARSNQHRLLALKEQQRLAAFPRSNPNPVLSLNAQGEIIYGNEAAYRIAAKTGLGSLLPDDMQAYLEQRENYQQWEFEKQGRHLHISLGWLSEYSEYHAYLNDISARKQAEQDLEYLAYHDATTGLINRQQFNEFVDGYLQGEGQTMLVPIIDINLLDTVVAAAGVSVAEKVARVAAMRLQHTVTEESYFKDSCLSYIGGGLFCFAYPDDRVEAQVIFHRMAESFTRPVDVDGYEFYLKILIGVVGSEFLEGGNCEEALRLADGALNLTKKQAGSSLCYYREDIEQAHQFRMRVELGLRHAIAKKQLFLYYQPKVSLIEGRIVGAEALLRWRGDDGHFVSPADFIPIAEDSGQILDIGNWVLEQACEDVARWNTDVEDIVDVAVNVSAKQLLHSDLSATVLSAMKRNHVPVEWVELEITETAALSDFELALARLHELRKHGIKLSLDDFGTGYSSLSYLQRLPVQTLKIDQSFIRSLVPGSKDEALASTMVEMAHQLEISVVAEGVETEEQLQMLHHWKCEYVQGYLIAAPMPLAEFIEFKRRFHASAMAQRGVL